MDLSRLSHAVTVAEYGSMTAAAHAIPLSQSALSRSIRALEREYGIQIFERGQSGTRLTTAGARFIERAAAMLRSVHGGESDLRDISTGQDAVVRFGVAPMSAAMLLGELLRDSLEAGEEGRFQVVTGTNSELLALLRDSQIEFYIGSTPAHTPGFAAAEAMVITPLPSVRPHVLVREGHPLLNSELTKEDLQRYPVISGAFIRDPDKYPAFASYGLQEPSIEVNDFHVLAYVAKTTDTILYATTLLMELRPDLRLVALPVEMHNPPVRYALIQRDSAGLSPAADRVVRRFLDGVARRLEPHSSRGQDAQ